MKAFCNFKFSIINNFISA